MTPRLASISRRFNNSTSRSPGVSRFRGPWYPAAHLYGNLFLFPNRNSSIACNIAELRPNELSYRPFSATSPGPLRTRYHRTCLVDCSYLNAIGPTLSTYDFQMYPVQLLAHYRILETTWLFWFASSRFKPRLLARPSTGRNDKNTHPAFPLSVPWTLLYTFHIGKPACFNTLIP